LNLSVSAESPTARGALYWGARTLGVVLWPGTGAVMMGHHAWNSAQDGARALARALEKIGRPGAWRF